MTQMWNVANMQRLPDYGAALTRGINSGLALRQQALNERMQPARLEHDQAVLAQRTQNDQAVLGQRQAEHSLNTEKARTDYENNMAMNLIAMKNQGATLEQMSLAHDRFIERGLQSGVFGEAEKAEIGQFGDDDILELEARKQAMISPKDQAQIDTSRSRLALDERKFKQDVSEFEYDRTLPLSKEGKQARDIEKGILTKAQLQEVTKSGEVSQREQKIMDAQKAYGLSWKEAVTLIDHTKPITDPITGKTTAVNIAEAISSPLAEKTIEKDDFVYNPEHEGLYQNADYSTGLESPIKSGMGKLQGFTDEDISAENKKAIQQRNSLKLASEDLLNSLRRNPRYAEGEAVRILKTITLEPKFHVSGNELRTKLSGLDRVLSEKADEAFKKFSDPNLESTERANEYKMYLDMQAFRRKMNVPPEESGSEVDIDALIKKYGK